MSDKYSQKWVTLFSKADKWAITLGQTTYYSCNEFAITPSWRRHEEEHKRQWREHGWLFALKYLWELRKGLK